MSSSCDLELRPVTLTVEPELVISRLSSMSNISVEGCTFQSCALTHPTYCFTWTTRPAGDEVHSRHQNPLSSLTAIYDTDAVMLDAAVSHVTRLTAIAHRRQWHLYQRFAL